MPQSLYDEILELPEHLVGEIIDGELFVSPIPAPRDSHTKGRLAVELMRHFEDRHDGWWIFMAVELHLGGDVLVPDIVGWKKERLPKIPDVPFMELVPDWICEVLPRYGTADHDRFRKMPRYALHKIDYAWIVDTIAHGVEIYERQDRNWLQVAMHHGTAPIRAVPFDACEIDLAPLWID